MKKKVLITLFAIIGIVIVLFLINFIKEKKDAKTEFLLDNENKYILEKKGPVTEGGLSGSKYYCEIDLNNKYIDYRYDFEYYEGIDSISNVTRFLNTKKRKLINRYKITEEQVIEIKEYFKKMGNNEADKVSSLTQESIKEISNGYYSVKTKDGSFKIKEKEHKRELKDIFKKINKNINL